jgi:hypothetical protein
MKLRTFYACAWCIMFGGLIGALIAWCLMVIAQGVMGMGG